MLLSPEIRSAFSGLIEKMINEALRHDPSTYHKLKDLDDKTASIYITDLSATFHLRVQQQYVHTSIYSKNDEVPPSDVSLQGQLTDLGALLGKDTVSLAKTGVEVQGQLALLTELQKLSKNLDIDWQGAVAGKLHSFFGDEARPVINSLLAPTFSALTQLHRAAKESTENHVRQLAHYLEYESDILPNKHELEQRQEDITRLRSDVDRLQVKMQKLQKQKNT